jgi:hypothetical protein
VHLRLVIDTVEPQAAREVDQRLLLVDLAQHSCRGLQRGELAVCVEDVELAVVLSEGCAGVCAAGIVKGAGQPFSLADNHRRQDAQQPVAIGSEILEDVDRAALVAENGNRIRSGHLRAHKLLRGLKRAHLIGGRQRCHVEVERQQPPVLVALVLHGLGRNLHVCEAIVDFHVLIRRGHRWQNPGRTGKILVLAVANGLRRAVFGQHEILCGEPVNKVALLVLHLDSFDHQIRIRLKGEALRSNGSLVLAHLLRMRARDNQEKQCADYRFPHHCHLT